jgi:hypothetical protein
MKSFVFLCLVAAAGVAPAFAQAPASGGSNASPAERARGRVGFGSHVVGKPERGSVAAKGLPATPKTASSAVTKTAPFNARRDRALHGSVRDAPVK